MSWQVPEICHKMIYFTRRGNITNHDLFFSSFHNQTPVNNLKDQLHDSLKQICTAFVTFFPNCKMLIICDFSWCFQWGIFLWRCVEVLHSWAGRDANNNTNTSSTACLLGSQPATTSSRSQVIPNGCVQVCVFACLFPWMYMHLWWRVSHSCEEMK